MMRRPSSLTVGENFWLAAATPEFLCTAVSWGAQPDCPSVTRYVRTDWKLIVVLVRSCSFHHW